MLLAERYTVTLTDSHHRHRPQSRVVYRSSDRDAIDSAERELRRHVNTMGKSPWFDGWRLTILIPPHWTVRIVAEVRPGYAYPAAKTVPSGDTDGFPF